MKTGRWTKILGVVLVAIGLLRPIGSFALSGPPPFTDIELTTWSFDSSNWPSDSGNSPISFTNLANPTDWDGKALQVDSPHVAWLQYNIVENDNTTNLAFSQGTIEFWFLPDWNSGSGPGDSGRLIDVGAYSTNHPSSWWSLYFSSAGTNLYFSSETNGIFTNYLSVPISWASNNWHLVDLIYSSSQSQLYLDGQLATNGSGVQYQPNLTTLTNGFFVGSDATGTQQMRGRMDDLATFNYALDAGQVAYDYQEATNTGTGGSTNFYNPAPDYGTNLFLTIGSMVSNTIPLVLSNTPTGVMLEIQGCTNLAQGIWFSEGFVDSSELTNWTSDNISVNSQGNLFLRIRSWADSTGTDIPDWWWLTYFDQTTNVDAFAPDPAGDSYDDLQKFQMGLNPYVYYNTNSPPDFFGCLDTTGTNVVLEWSNAPGPVVSYVVQRGILGTNGNYVYSQFVLSSNATFFVDSGAISNANSWNNFYTLTAVYPYGANSGTDTWSALSAENEYNFPPYGAPIPNNVYAYLYPNGTNVLLSWTPPIGGTPTNYIVIRGNYVPDTGGYDYVQIASVKPSTNYFVDVGVISNGNDTNDIYEVEAMYSGKGLSQPSDAADITTTVPSPTGISATLDTTGTNVLLSWTPPQGLVVTNYIIERGILNTNTGNYSYSQIGEVNASTTSFVDSGAITGNNSYYNEYEVEAVCANGATSEFDTSYLPGPPPPQYANLYLTANLVRNGTGRWQVMFSGLNTNVPSIELTWSGHGDTAQQIISTSTLTNGIYQIPDAEVVILSGESLKAQLLDANGNLGQIAQAGTIPNDAPYFVDGRQHLKQNLEFVIRAAALEKPFGGTFGDSDDDNQFNGSGYNGRLNQSATNFEEFSFIYHNVALDNLWPFAANYYLANFLVDVTRTNLTQYPIGNTNFNFTVNFATNIPAPPILGNASPYWIIQPGSNLGGEGDASTYSESTNWGLTLANDYTTEHLQSGLYNLFGLSYGTGCEADLLFDGDEDGFKGIPAWLAVYQSLSPGGSVTVVDDTNEYYIGTYASLCPAPTLTLTNYYFAPLLNPYENPMSLPAVSQQPIPTPIDDTFNVTNQTPLVIAGSVGQPMIVGGWAKYHVQGSANKSAYLGQYFETNCLLLSANGSLTTNNAGILSPYGEFFPLQAGRAQLVTMPDIDPPYGQGTGIVDVISLNVDANHDGTMDFSYVGPDFVSPSKPFRFWVNDDQDIGDDDGNGGVPGLTFPEADALNPAGMNYQKNEYFYKVHGTRDLVDYFPVYINIGSLFQSNALSSGVSATDTNYQFVLSQADSALRFAYTSLTPTNYMNYLLVTNVAESLSDQLVYTIDASGTTLSQDFIASIATNNGGIILVEGATNTVQPLALTVYHGTNQIAQTLLPVSISGVEQMFRSKTILLNPGSGTNADRLTDASVPNEPGTTDMNFILVHGYNVNPQQARGWDADYYKRLYWSGSHAKFYGLTWEASDSQKANAVTINLESNIVNGFITAPLLNGFLNSLGGTNVVAAHSLGNILVLSTLNDCTNRNINSYFMVDAAVAIEAVDTTAPLNPDMYPTAWTNYANRLWASEWHNLFPTNDARSMLTWSGRLTNFQNAAVYNFYSSGEEVLRDYPGDPPNGTASIAEGQFIAIMKAETGEYTWAWQEKLKGLMNGNGLLSSDHGGWLFNSSYATLSAATAASLPNAELQTNAFVYWGDNGESFTPFNYDLALETSSGTAYAQTNRNRILSDAIPCLTLPVGANLVPRLQASGRNFDMQALFENNWPADRGAALYGAKAAGEWHHSDNRAVAYIFTHKLFDEMVTLGNLK